MSLRLKILIALALLLCTASGTYSVIIAQQAATWVRTANECRVAEISARLALAVERAGRPGPLPEGPELAKLLRIGIEQSAGRGSDCAVKLEDGAGNHTLVTLNKWPAQGAAPRRRVQILVAGRPGEGLRKLQMWVAMPPSGFGQILEAAYAPLAAVILLTFLLGTLLFMFLNHAYLRPVMALRRAAQEVADGRLEAEIKVETGDELQELAESFSGMLDRLADMQELALDANPLTGLPGNATIQRRLESATGGGEALAVVYVDIDNFKAYNDVYGFETGDRAIAFVAELLVKTCSSHDSEAFVGHIGGDDFLFAVRAGLAVEVAEEIINKFDGRVGEFYSEEDRRQGYVISKDRQHREQRFGLMALSMGCVDIGARKFSHFSELAAAAAELKGQAKKQPGSVFLTDRRKI